MKITYSFAFAFLCFFCASCFHEESWDPGEPVFMTSHIGTADKVYTYFSATIDKDQYPFIRKDIEDHGFVWSEKRNNTLENARIISLGKRESHKESFSARASGLEGGSIYFVRAFIKLKGAVYYANETSFETRPGTWTRLSDFPAEPIVNATGFAVGGKGYIVGGAEVWAFDPELNDWNRKNNFPAVTSGATSFVIDDVAYVYCGGLWKYEPEADAWHSIEISQDEWTSLGCEGVNSFTINGKAYVSGGIGTMVEYDPLQNTWSSSIFYSPRVAYAAAFSLYQKGYVVGGTTTSGSYSEEVSKYDVPEEKWERMGEFLGNRNLPKRTEMICFQIGNKAYLGMGYTAYGVQSDFYNYNPFTDTWALVSQPVYVDENNEVKYLGRAGGVSFVIGDKGYMGLGEIRRYEKDTDSWSRDPLSDFWEFSIP